MPPTLIAFVAYAAMAAGLWQLVRAWQHRGWAELPARVLRFDAAGRMVTVETAPPGPLRVVPWPLQNRSIPAPGTMIHVVHPPGDAARLKPWGGSRRSLRHALGLFAIGALLLGVEHILLVMQDALT